MSRRSYIAVLLATLLVGVFLGGCRKGVGEADQRVGRLGYSSEVARLVSHATSGVISSGSEINVRFTSPVVDESVVGNSLEERVFNFNPRIDGEIKWTDTQTLTFTPANPLPLRQAYTGSLDLTMLLPRWQNRKMEPLPLAFETGRREIESFSGDFELQNGDDPQKLVYSGRLVFTEPADLSLVKKSVVLSLREKQIPLEWRMGSSLREFDLVSSAIERAEERQILSLHIKSSALDLSAPYERFLAVQPVTSFVLTDIIADTAGSVPAFIMTFSDELSYSQDINGLISIEPPVDIRLKKTGKTVTVSGEFEFGESYTLICRAGIQSRWAAKTEKEARRTVTFEDLKPSMSFLHAGVFLPSAGNRRIYFRTVNLRNVRLEVKKVFENNLGQFLQTEKLTSSRNRNEDFRRSYVSRVGVVVAEKVLPIGEQRNIWLNHELDLAALIEPSDRGLFLVSLFFEREDMIYKLEDEETHYWSDDYYTNPNSYGYLRVNGRIYKPLMVSDLGLTWKAGHDRHLVFATNILDASPVAGVSVSLLTYQNQLLAAGLTDSDGKVGFASPEEDVFYVIAEKEGQRSVIKSNEMGWNLAGFDTEGAAVSVEGTRAFLYTERGIHRPGDTIYLSAIIRNHDNTFPDNHPVTLKLYNPLNQLVHEEINIRGQDGFYAFELATGDNDPTGNWKVELIAGSTTFYKGLRIETIVPYRLKVHVDPEKEAVTVQDERLAFRLSSTYLFGAPAAGLIAEAEVQLRHSPRKFPAYSDFVFTDESKKFTTVRDSLFEGPLNQEGAAELEWYLPSLDGAPSGLDIALVARVFEKGGRAVRKTALVRADPYDYYVGLKKPAMKYGYARIGQAVEIPVLVTDLEGRPASGRELHYSIYRNDMYWWWEYDSHDDFKLRYKSDSQTELLDEGSLVSSGTPISLEAVPDAWGEYFVEVKDQSGHAAGFFFRASAWGGGLSGGDDAGLLLLSADRNKYAPGDEAEISLPSADKGALLVTIEKANSIISAQWHEPEEGETRIKVKITEEMIPTAYVTVSLVQPYVQTLNDRPIRMYGVVPLNVEKESTHLGLEISLPDEIKPKDDFIVKIQTTDRRKAQYSLAVVDEGLLDLTEFKTPDPWTAFYRKERLGVTTYDLYSQIIGAHGGDIFKTFSIGGGEGELSERGADTEKARFVPVVLFQGPTFTDEKGSSEVRLTMPNYMGSVRVMVVSARGESYGMVEKSVPVRDELILLPTLPRVIGPGERIKIPVTLFALKDDIGRVTVQLKTTGPVAVEGEKRKELVLNRIGEADLAFGIKTLPAVGTARIDITASGGRYSSQSVVHLPIRASSPPVYKTERGVVERGRSVSLRIPDDGLPGTNKAVLTVMRHGNLALSRRLNYLIRYPYGCIEQTTSAVFPQLFLKDVVNTGGREEKTIDKNINAGIQALRRFQLPSGAFSFWPGSNSLSVWGTNYAGHFLIEAERLGYHVPAFLRERWLDFQYSRSLTSVDDLTSRVYRVYLLALAGRPAPGPMNLLRESLLDKMNDTQKWVLAAAYKLAGMDEAADSIVYNTGVTVGDYREFAGSYGSALRDRALILEMAVRLRIWEIADSLYSEITERLASDFWYSTQTTGYCLLAAGRYMQSQKRGEQPLLKGRIILPDRTEIPFSTEDHLFKYELEGGYGGRLQVFIDRETSIERVPVLLEWEGIPLKSEETGFAQNITLTAKWYDDFGRRLDPSAITQGTVFWGHFRVRKTTPYRIKLEELALTQILPSGWEIENIRLTNESVPPWLEEGYFNIEEYTDIRDDRISWFFDMSSNIKYCDFVVKCQAVTEGTFVFPSGVCEAMYQRNYRAVLPGGTAVVSGRD